MMTFDLGKWEERNPDLDLPLAKNLHEALN